MITKFDKYQKIFENKDNINSKIDFTYIKPDVNINKIKEICEIAKKNNYYAVCIRSEFINDARIFLEDSDVKIVTVIDFPTVLGGKIGESKLKIKLKDIREAIINGTDEIDIPINYKAYIKSENKEEARNELKEEVSQISHLCSSNGVVLKVVIETGELTFDEIKDICGICSANNVDFIQTSTGYGKKGAELDKVSYMREILPDFIRIKAAGGIQSLEQAEKFLKKCSRIGTSESL